MYANLAVSTDLLRSSEDMLDVKPDGIFLQSVGQ